MITASSKSIVVSALLGVRLRYIKMVQPASSCEGEILRMLTMINSTPLQLSSFSLVVWCRRFGSVNASSLGFSFWLDVTVGRAFGARVIEHLCSEET